jgi:hypothetical protein
LRSIFEAQTVVLAICPSISPTYSIERALNGCTGASGIIAQHTNGMLAVITS